MARMRMLGLLSWVMGVARAFCTSSALKPDPFLQSPGRLRADDIAIATLRVGVRTRETGGLHVKTSLNGWA